jgi:hypothetical protein
LISKKIQIQKKKLDKVVKKNLVDMQLEIEISKFDNSVVHTDEGQKSPE